MEATRVYTIESGKIFDGAAIENFFGRPAVVIGGEGAKRGVIAVEGCGEGRMFFAEVAETSAGKKFVARESAADAEKIIVVFRTVVPGCGGNSHVGARIKNGGNEVFPGEILATGTVTLGAGGRKGYGRQYVVLMPKNKIFGIVCFGREQNAHYFQWDGKNLLSVS